MDNVKLGVFPICLENDLSKLDKILGLTFFKARRIQNGVFPFTIAVFWSMDCLQLPFIRVEEAVS